MDKKKAVYNIAVSLAFKLIILFLALLSRRYLIRILGNEANGVYSLFLSVIGFLSIAELGIGSAITFNMYKPIVEKNYVKVTLLYRLYKKVYLIVALVILIIGPFLTLFLNILAKGNTGSFNLSLNYLIILFATVTSYFYAYKTSYINAHKDDYITISIRSLGLIAEAIMQILFLKYFKSFELFFVSILISNLMQWILTNYIFRKKYMYTLINEESNLDMETRKEVIDKAKAMFMHKIGGLLVNTLNGVIISAFVGVVMLGKYMNYTTILAGISSLLVLTFTAITSILGHSYAKNTPKVFHSQFKKAYVYNYIIGVIFYIGFLAISDELIRLIFSDLQVLDRKIVVVLTINYFVQFMRQSTLTFKDASGTYYYDRYKPFFEGVINLSLSILLVRTLGVSGVLLSTIITNLLICHIIEPFVLYKHGFKNNPTKYYLINYLLISIFLVSVFLFEIIDFKYTTNIYWSILQRGFFSIIFSSLILIITYIFISPIRKEINLVLFEILKYIKGFRKKQKN